MIKITNYIVKIYQTCVLPKKWQSMQKYAVKIFIFRTVTLCLLTNLYLTMTIIRPLYNHQDQ